LLYHQPVGIGVSDTKEEALDDLRMELMIEFLKETGQPVPGPSMELVSIEVPD
jgi:hypothetical protein